PPRPGAPEVPPAPPRPAAPVVPPVPTEPPPPEGLLRPQAPVGLSRPRKVTTSPYRFGLTVSRSCFWLVGPRFVSSRTFPELSLETGRAQPLRPVAEVPALRFDRF